MYPEQHTKSGLLKHSTQCSMAFGRLDANCPRCVELKNGAPARSDPYTMRQFDKDNERRHLEYIKNHDCKESRCGVVCTAFEW